jgi:ChaB protein
MPRSIRSSLPSGEKLPGTLRRSSKEAQDTFTKAHDTAVQAHGEGDLASREAYTELKKTFEKRGDQWIPKVDPGPATMAG